MDLISIVLDKYGLRVAIVFYILQQIYSLVVGSTKKYLKAINDNTKEISSLRAEIRIRLDKLDFDLETAFHNIEVLGGGKIIPNKRPRKDS